MREAPPVMLLHGQPGGPRDWGRVLSALGGRLQVIAPARPGYDRRTPPGGVAHNAEAALDELDRQEIACATVVGFSFGGAVAAWLAAEHPERVARLILVSPAANTAALIRADRLLAAPLLGPLVSAAAIVVDGPRTLETLRAFVTEQRALFTELPRLSGRLAEIAAPTTIVCGDHDHIVPPDANRLLATQIPGAELVEIPGARHGLVATHPDLIARLILGGRGEFSGGARTDPDEVTQRRSRAASRERQEPRRRRESTPA